MEIAPAWVCFLPHTDYAAMAFGARMSQKSDSKVLSTEYLLGTNRMSVLVGPCHHGMARPQVADRGTASDKEGSCE